MADISKIKTLNGTTYDIKDSTARQTMTGATSSTNGASGQVPAPTSSDVGKFLRGDGTWQTVSSGGGSVDTITMNGTTYSPTSGTINLGTVVTDVSGKADKADTVLDTTLSRGRKADTTIGTGSFAFGNNVTASGNYSLAAGNECTASGNQSHAEGAYCTSRASNSHAEGNSSFAYGNGSHAEGGHTIANEVYSHSEGEYTYADGRASHSSGRYNVHDTGAIFPAWESGTSYQVDDQVRYDGSVWVCRTANADTEFDSANWLLNSYFSFAETVGNGIDANNRSNARALDWDGNERLKGTLYVGCNADSTGGSEVARKTDTVLDTTLSRGRVANTTVGTGSFAFGNNVTASGYYSHAEGNGTLASGINAHAEGYDTTASVDHSHAEGLRTTASGLVSHAEGMDTIASGDASHAEGDSGTASGVASHVEGTTSYATGSYAHAEGRQTTSSGVGAHSEGKGTNAAGNYSHAEGEQTTAYAQSSHVVGRYNSTDTYVNWDNWVSGTSYSVGDKVQRMENNKRVGYVCKTANSDVDFDSSNWDKDVLMNYVEIVGNGQNTNNKSNARAVDWDGNEYLYGDLYINCDADSTGGTPVSSFAPSIGEIKMFSGLTAPDKWLICDGSTISRTTYSDLFDVISTTYGGGDGSTTFAIPNFQGRSPLGVGESSATGHTAHTLGLTGGEEKHTLVTGELASHAHTFSKATATTSIKYSAKRGTGSENTPYNSGSSTTSNWATTTLSLTLNNSGSNTAHNTLHPYLNVNFIIYTGVSSQ